MPQILAPPLPQLCKCKHLRTPFPYAYIPIELTTTQPTTLILISTCFVLFNGMKQITNGPTTKFTFIVLLLQKQCINFINPNIDNNY